MVCHSLMEVTHLQLAKRSAFILPPSLCGEQRPALHLGLQLSESELAQTVSGAAACFLPHHSMSLWNETSELLTTICIII